MIAFSKVPDQFEEQYQKASFSIALTKTFQIQSIGQGKCQSRQVADLLDQKHMIANSNNAKNLSVNVDEKVLEEVGRDRQVQALSINQLAKAKLERQKLIEAQNLPIPNQLQTGRFISCNTVCLQPQNTQIILSSPVSNNYPQAQIVQHHVLTPENQSEINRTIYHNLNSQLSHIVISPSQTQNSKILLHKKPIFTKQMIDRVPEKSHFSQNIIFPIKKLEQHESQQRNENIQKPSNFIPPLQVQVQQHIQCTLFGNRLDKNDFEELKNTGFILNPSEASQVKYSSPIKHKSTQVQQDLSRINKTNSLHESYLSLKSKINKLGGSKTTKNPNHIVQQTKNPPKLNLTKLVSIQPTFF